MLSTGLDYLTTAAKWAHGNAKTIPHVGNIYTLFCEKVGTPGWNLACKATNAAAPHFNKIKDPVMEKATKHPHITMAVGSVLTLFLLRALYKKHNQAP